jgi:hypothetical protein
MKKIKYYSLIFGLPILLGFINLKPDKSVNGYFISQDGQKKTVKILLKSKELFLPENSKYDISEYRIVTQGQYIGENGKKENITSKIKEFGFEYSGEKFVFQIVRIKKEDAMFGTSVTDKFCKLIIDGPCKLYHNFEERADDLGRNRRVVTNLVIVKQGYQPFYAYTGLAGKMLTKSQNDVKFADIFPDCQELQKKISKKEFKNDPYGEAVGYYNSSCKIEIKQTENKPDKEEKEEKEDEDDKDE